MGGAFNECGAENIAYFVDNNIEKVGTFINGVEVISWDKLLEIRAYYEKVIIIKYSESIEQQLRAVGIKYQHPFEGNKRKIYKTKKFSKFL